MCKMETPGTQKIFLVLIQIHNECKPHKVGNSIKTVN